MNFEEELKKKVKRFEIIINRYNVDIHEKSKLRTLVREDLEKAEQKLKEITASTGLLSGGKGK